MRSSLRQRQADVSGKGHVSMNRLVVEIQNMRWGAWAGGSPLVEGGCWDHTGYPALDIARMAAKNRGLEDVEYQLSLVL